MGLTIDIRDLVTPLVDHAARTLNDRRGASRAAAEGALPVFQKRFREMGSSNVNPFGARGGFWNRMVSGTVAGSNDEKTAFVRMPREVALRRFGGTVRPKKAKFLAIAARAEAYGKSPRQFSDLRFVALRGGRGMLVQRDQTQIKRYTRGKKKGQVQSKQEVGGGVYYWLVKSATVRPNAEVLPTDGEIAQAAIDGVGIWYNLQVRRRMR